MMAAPGSVSTHAQTMLFATGQRMREMWRTRPVPVMAPAMVCVVETGTPSVVAMNSAAAPLVRIEWSNPGLPQLADEVARDLIGALPDVANFLPELFVAPGIAGRWRKRSRQQARRFEQSVRVVPEAFEENAIVFARCAEHDPSRVVDRFASCLEKD